MKSCKTCLTFQDQVCKGRRLILAWRLTCYMGTKAFKVTGNALNIEYYFWWRDDCFGLLIHHDAPFHFMVSISEE